MPRQTPCAQDCSGTPRSVSCSPAKEHWCRDRVRWRPQSLISTN